MTTTLKLIPIGDSQGLCLPEWMVTRYHLQGEVTVTATSAGLLVEPAAAAKLSLEETFAEMAKEGGVQEELEAWAPTLMDGLEDEEFADWPR
jgi:antitoxin component of MazEF toxin-antitoxin module